MINCFSVRSSQRAFTRQKYYLHFSTKNLKLKSLTTSHNLRHEETNIWLKAGHRKVTVKLKYKWVISQDYLHLTTLCGMYFTLPKVLITVLQSQHLVNIKIIIQAIITFQTLLTCSDLHRTWLLNYTKTLKRRKMVSCSYSIYRRSQVSKKVSYWCGSSSPQEADRDMTWVAGAHFSGFLLPRAGGHPTPAATSGCTYAAIGGLFA